MYYMCFALRGGGGKQVTICNLRGLRILENILGHTNTTATDFYKIQKQVFRTSGANLGKWF